jgi:hypothetical protein
MEVQMPKVRGKHYPYTPAGMAAAARAAVPVKKKKSKKRKK